jgi:hypothetical protein
VSRSRFLAKTVSIIKAEKAAVSRFLVRHPRLSRFLAHVPAASKFLPLPTVATVPPVRRSLGEGGHVAPVYNARARKIRPPTPTL